MKLVSELQEISAEWVANCCVFNRTANSYKTAYVVYTVDSEYGHRDFRRLFFDLHSALDFAQEYASDINYGCDYVEFLWDPSSGEDDNYLSVRAGGYEYTDVAITVCTEVNGVVNEHTSYLYAYDTRDWSVNK